MLLSKKKYYLNKRYIIYKLVVHLFSLHIFFSDSAHSFGATVACFLAGILMSSFGRRGSTLYFTIPCYFFGYIIIGSASNYMMLIGPISLLNINDLKNLKTYLNHRALQFGCHIDPAKQQRALNFESLVSN